MKKFLSIAMVAVMLVALCSTVFAADGATMTVGTVDGYRGEKVVVPVVVSNNPGIAAATVTITYDTNNLKLNKKRWLDSEYLAVMRANLNHLVILNEFQRIANLLLCKANLVICLCVHEVV